MRPSPRICRSALSTLSSPRSVRKVTSGISQKFSFTPCPSGTSVRKSMSPLSERPDSLARTRVHPLIQRALQRMRPVASGSDMSEFPATRQDDRGSFPTGLDCFDSVYTQNPPDSPFQQPTSCASAIPHTSASLDASGPPTANLHEVLPDTELGTRNDGLTGIQKLAIPIRRVDPKWPSPTFDVDSTKK